MQISTATMKKQVLLLASSQAIFQTTSILVMTIGSLAGAQIATNASQATYPIASMFLGSALATIPASMLMAKIGRRWGFMFGAFLGVLAGIIASFGVMSASLPLLCLGTFFVGLFQGFAQFYRFAASEVADQNFRPKAIGYVLAGGVVAAILGPYLGQLGGPLLEPKFTASFLLLSFVAFVGMTLLFWLKIPNEKIEKNEDNLKARSLWQIMSNPTYATALLAALTGNGVMILAMTATPLAMVHHGHSLAMATSVIQMHVMGMFLPSFFTGSLITRFGVIKVMVTGVLLLTLHVVLALSGTEYYSFAAALILLGIGWNFLYIGGTNMVTTAYHDYEKGKAQGMNDFVIFLVGLGSSIIAGVLYETMGWQKLNMFLLPWLGFTCIVIIIYGRLNNKRSQK